MALNNVPLNGETLNHSKPLINQNFVTIDNTFSVNHVPYGSGVNAGKHNLVAFPVQGSAPSFSAGEDGLYNKLYAGTNLNELFIHQQYSAGTRDIPFTATTGNTIAGTQGTPGYTYLPSGLLVKWGVDNRTGDSGTVTMPTTNNGIAIPAFSITLWMGLTTFYPGITSDTPNGFVRLMQWNANTYRVYCSNRTTTGPQAVGFTWIAIGIGV